MTTSTTKTALRALLTGTIAIAAAAALSSCSVISGIFGDEKIEVTVPDTLVAAGSTVAVGETILVPGEATNTANSTSEPTDIGLTVTSITESDASFFDKLDNPEKFAGYTPWLVVSQFDLPTSLQETHEKPTTSPLYGVLADGSFAEFLTLNFGSSGDVSDLCPGARSTDAACDVILVPAGGELSSIEWDAQTPNTITGMTTGDESSPYYEAPLRWSATTATAAPGGDA
ncbi:hypothetical protein F8O01_06880 [Pseudoclavibacter chungangensis]|uniref:Uncharacterized protein n=1 Tax=Pseudoclavibacter chungangensis TaxID=587635 RepID=A0A7J5BUF3_9MICO|nr:hypothetical protein [Pseudoclavibacter chungangensis]KAB1657987.1 hypothetical protein F8O01_06880 [Pseudoclavibacter chungangensis]NYJ65855.1 hypothetical protein [Pseudoclavibacter chungangensis]